MIFAGVLHKQGYHIDCAESAVCHVVNYRIQRLQWRVDSTGSIKTFFAHYGPRIFLELQKLVHGSRYLQYQIFNITYHEKLSHPFFNKFSMNLPVEKFRQNMFLTVIIAMA